MSEELNVFLPLDVDEDNLVKLKDESNEARPHCFINMGPPHGEVMVLYPPKEEQVEGRKLTYNNLITLIRQYRILPVQVGMAYQFVSWAEAAGGKDNNTQILFGWDLVRKYLYEQFDITASKEGEEDEQFDHNS
jgi:hypothetical protein